MNTCTRVVLSSGMAIALGVLGTAYSDLGQLDTARELLQRSVRMNQDFHGPQHIGTAIAQTDLGRVTRLAGDLQEARRILENALETKEKIQGKEHPSECTVFRMYYNTCSW